MKTTSHFLNVLLLLACCNYALAVTTPTPACPIISGNFSGIPDGTTSSNTAIGWTLDASGVPASAVYFACKSNRIHAEDLGGIGIWRSNVYSTSGYSSFQVAVKVHSEGDMNSTEYAKIYYKINGGSEILLDERTGNFGTIDFISPELTGTNVQLIVKLYNYNNGGSQTSKYHVEEYRVFKEAGPCSGTAITVSASADRTVLTCANPSATLSAGSTASGVTYSWTGPNSFTSTSQNPVVSAGGTYTVTGTSSAGTGTASVTLTENKSGPGVTATGGSLSCGSTVALTASSSTSGVTYSWTGPNSFASAMQNPAVSTAGTYNVTVTNPANGCTSSQSVQVTAGTSFWLEEFTFGNGTTADTGTTPWTITNTSSGTFAVTSNEFKVFGIGTSTQGVWTSGTIDITGKTNVSISVDTRSSGVAMNTSGTYMDYIRIYYKLNGGSEVLFSEQLGNVNNHSTTNTTVSVGSLSGTSLQVIVKARASGSDEFYYFDNVKVAGNSQSFTASASASGPLTCSTSSVGLTGGASVSGVTYSWSGPGSFTSSSQNPSVNTAGTYTLIVTNSSGCTATASVMVAENKTAPGVSATGGSLTCAANTTLSASSPTSGVTYSWTGPGSFTSSSQNPVVTAAGTYTVIATGPNGCTSSQSVTVTTSGGTSSFWLEDFNLTNGTATDTGNTSWSVENTSSGVFSVQNSEFRVNAIGTSTEGVWTSGTIDISGKSNVSVSTGVRSGVSSGGALENSGSSLDYIRVYYKLNGGSEVLVSESLGTINSNSSTNTTVSVGSLSGTSLQVVIRARTTTSDEFYYFDNVTVTGTSQSITASASVSGTLTCSVTSVTLSGSSNMSSGITYSWTGPNNFTSSAQNPVVSAPGIYTLTVANSTGCSGTASVTVTQSSTPPGATASVSGSLACGASVTLNGSSSTSGVNYAWTGPNNFTSASQNPVVSTSGTYTLTVTNPANNCTSTQSVQVTSAAANSTVWLEDFAGLSNGATSDTGTTSWSVTNTSSGTFSVNTNEFRVSGIGASTQGVWTSGSIDITNKANVAISVNTRSSGVVMNSSGTYLDYLRIYYKLNGGSEVLFSEQIGSINSHSTTPATVSIGSLSGTSLQIIVKARATGTDEFYYFDNVKVTGTAVSSSFTVAIPAPATLTCTTPSITLAANGSVSGLSYSWTGPNGFTSVQQNPVVTVAGQYTVTASQGGCAAMASVTVSENKTAPSVTASGGVLTCTTSVTLAASSTTSGVTYSWTGPNGFTSIQSNPVVSTPGTYTVVVRNPANGCTNTQSVTVTTSTGTSTASDFWVENFTFANGTTVDTGTTSWSVQNAAGTFSVQNNEFKISNPSGTQSIWLSGVVDISAKSDVVISALLKSGTTSTNDYLEEDDYVRVYYKLNGGAEVLAYENYGGFNDNNNTSQSYAFTYATPLNGSTLQVVIRVRNSNATELYYFDDVKLNGKNSPLGVITTSVSGPISCTNASVQLSASTTVSGATYYWIRPDGTTISQQNPTVSVPGNYVVVVSANGCQATQSVTVSGSQTPPDVSIIGNNFSCSGGSSTVNLTAYSSVPGVTYVWTGPSTITNATAATASVSAGGVHTVTVTNPANACTNTASFNVSYSDGTTTPVWNETFDELSDGITSENGATAWSTDNSKIHTVSLSAYSDETGTPYYQEVRGGNLTVKTTRGEVVWTSQPISISAHGQVQLKADVTGEGSLNDETDCGSDCFDYDYVKISYKLNGGPETPFSTNGSFPGKLALTGLTASTGILSGSTVQIVIRSYNTGNNEIFHYDNIQVLKVEAGSSTVSAAASGAITCTNTTATLTATPVVSGATYAWSGPGGTTYTGSSVNVNAGGTYNLSVSGSGGCLSGATASVVVTENKTAPVVTVSTPDILTCTRTSLTLTAVSSPSSDVSYLWTRPDGSTLSSTGLTTSAPGIYTIKVTNTLNGCFAQTAVEVFRNNTAPDVTVSASNPITCAVASVDVVASSGTAGVTYAWSGPGTITNPSSPTASVNAGGIYTVTVTNPTTGCVSTANVTVAENKTLPGATASVSAPLTCARTIVTLTGASGTSGVTYAWSGPGTITNPNSATATVTTPGTYTVTVTNPTTSCVSTANVTVTESTTLPGATATVSGPITCNTAAVTLTGNSGTSGVTYLWSGPGSITNPESASATVTAVGTYTVTVTNPVTGCQSTADVTVTENKTLPGAGASVTGQITCNAASFATLTATSGTSGVTYAWTGPGTITNPTSATATTKTAGTYTVTVTNSATGCQSTANVIVTENKTLPGANASVAGEITCNAASFATLTATSGTSGVTYAWTGPGTITNPTSATATTKTAGTYTVTVTNSATGCQSTANVIVTENKTLPGANASVAGEITCNAASFATLTATSGTSGVTYAWTGPGTITNPTSATATTKTAGTYTVTVTNSATGCQSTANVTVTENKTLPGANASVAGEITCNAASFATLTATSGTSGVTYAWSGPGTITNPTSATATTKTAGTYTVTVTNTATGCQSTANVTVTENKTLPGANASVAGEITCNAASFATLTATSGTSGVTYAWSGPGTITNPTSATATTKTVGTYTVTVTNTATSCVSTANVTVTENKTLPEASASVAGQITCNAASFATLTATSGTSGVTYSWSGPGTITNPTSATATTKTAGTYTVTVTRTSTGCQSTANVTVTEDKTLPGANASVTGQITCNPASFATLTATSGTSGVTYAWSGPGTVTNPTSATATVSVAGTYTVTVTRTSTGCQSDASVIVTQNKTLPGASASVAGTFTCTVGAVTLTGNSATANAIYQWTGPGNFSSPLQNPVVNVAGTYTLRVTDPANDCISDPVTTTTPEDKTPPGVSIGVPETLTCSRETVTLQASSGTNDLLYSWTGPGNFISSEQNPSTNVAGDYTVIARNPANGCTSTATRTVTENRTEPEQVTATVTGVLNCSGALATLHGGSATTGVTYAWEGPGGYARSEQNPTTDVAGPYKLTVTNSANGCKVVITGVIVQEDKQDPQGVTAVASNNLTCTLNSAVITGGPASGVSYSWTGPGTFTSTAGSFTATVKGVYSLTVTSNANHCTATTSVELIEDKAPPLISVSNPLNTNTLTCFVNPIPLIGSSGTPGVTYRWTSLAGLDTNTPSIQVNVPSDYTFTVTAPNGCQVSTMRRINQNLINPVATASVSGVLNCNNTSVDLNGGTTVSPVTYSWTGPSNFSSTLEDPQDVTEPGIYTVTILTAGGCTDSESVNVQKNISAPDGVSIVSDGSLNCGSGFVILQGNSSTPDVTYHWTGPGLDTTDQETFVTDPGTYKLTVTHPQSGCTVTREITIVDEGC